MQYVIIPEMSCGHCVATIRATLQTAAPDAKIEIDLAQHQLAIASPLQEVQIQMLHQQVGFSATVLATCNDDAPTV